MDVKQFVERYIRGELKNGSVCGNWHMINWGGMDVLQYFSTTGPEVREYNRVTDQREYSRQKEPERIAYRLLDGSILFNSNQLVYAVKYSWGNKLNNRGTGQTDQQIQLERAGCIPIPFMIFEEIPGADVRDFSWVVKPKSETIIERVPDGYRWDESIKKSVQNYKDRSRHFSGACVFKILEEYFLFDIDRHEITENKIFNPFISKLLYPVETIDQAYKSLMPIEVEKAISAGIEVKRQGEYFFVFHSSDTPANVKLTDKEKKILRFIPSRNGFGILNSSENDLNRPFDRWDDCTSFYPNYPLNTPAKKEFQKYALMYEEVQKKKEGMSSKSGTLSKNDSSGSHTVEKFIQLDGITYASGTIKQSRREHGDLTLTGWYRVYANTGVQNWTITGKID